MKFEFSSPRDGATFECHLDGAAFRACSSPATYAGLSSGSHLFEVRAVDGDAKDPSPAKAVFTLDLTAPDTELLSGPSGVVTAFPVSFEFAATEQGARFECALDGAAFAACTSPLTIPELAEGSHRFEVRALDALGNADASPASRDFTVDRYAPETQLDAAPSGTITSDTTTVAFSSSEAGSTFECALDAGAFVACTSPRTLTGLSDGAAPLLRPGDRRGWQRRRDARERLVHRRSARAEHDPRRDPGRPDLLDQRDVRVLVR